MVMFRVLQIMDLSAVLQYFLINVLKLTTRIIETIFVANYIINFLYEVYRTNEGYEWMSQFYVYLINVFLLNYSLTFCKQHFFMH